MGVARIGRKRTKAGFLKNGVDGYRHPETSKRRSVQTMKIFVVIAVAIIAVGLVVGWMRAFLLAR
jgi:hypothetical protein